MKSSELLQSGQEAIELSEGGAAQPGATHAENARFGEARDLGPGDVREMFGPAQTPRQRLEGQGFKFVESEAERGGGGDVDPVEDYFKKVRLDKIQGFIAEQQGKNYPDTSSIKLPDGTSILFGEYKKIATTIQEAQARGDRRPIAEIIREARRLAPPPPEPRPKPQPAPRPGDWRESLPLDQRQRLKEKEQRWDQLQPAQLTAMQEKIAAALSNWGLGIDWPDELKKANLLPGEANLVLRALGEEINKKKEIQTSEQLQRTIIILGLRPHFDLLKSQLELSSDISIIEYLRGAERQARLLLRNLPPELFPPEIKSELISLIRSRGNGGM